MPSVGQYLHYSKLLFLLPIETGAGTELKVFEMGHLGDHPGRHISASTSRGSSQADLLECSTSSDTPKSPLPFMVSQGKKLNSCKIK